MSSYRHGRSTPDSDSGFLASYLIFPIPAAGEAAAQIGDRADSRITNPVTNEKIGDGPQ